MFVHTAAHFAFTGVGEQLLQRKTFCLTTSTTLYWEVCTQLLLLLEGARSLAWLVLSVSYSVSALCRAERLERSLLDSVAVGTARHCRAMLWMKREMDCRNGKEHLCFCRAQKLHREDQTEVSCYNRTAGFSVNSDDCGALKGFPLTRQQQAADSDSLA